MNRAAQEELKWIDFTIQVTHKKNLGAFGIKRERHEFRFCARSPEDALYLAAANVPAFEEIQVRVIDSIPIEAPKRDPFPMVHKQIKSCREVLSEQEARVA